MHRLVEKVERYIRQERLLEDRQRVLVGVSGGADSVGLLMVLVELIKSGKLNIELVVGHLEHGIRGEQSKTDAEFVAELAKKLGLSICVEAVDVPSLAAEGKVGLESAARATRYDFFARAAEQKQCSTVALAHQADDQVETVLHRIIRGTGLAGLAGIRPRRKLKGQPEIYIVRPMLSCRRVEIEQFLRDGSISWRTDHTNLGVEATRNRIRNTLLPSLKDKFNPRVDEAMLRLASVAEGINDFLEEHTAGLFESVVREFDALACIDLEGLGKSHRALQCAVVRRVWADLLRMPQRDMSFDAIEDILLAGREHLANNRPNRVALPGGGWAVFEFGKLLLMADEYEPSGFEPVTLSVPGKAFISELNLTVRAKLLPKKWDLSKQLRPTDPRHELIDGDCVCGQLVIRAAKAEEIIKPFGGRTKTMKEFLTSCKIPRLLHPLTGVLSDEQGPLWVIGYRLDQRAEMKSESRRAIELSCE